MNRPIRSMLRPMAITVDNLKELMDTGARYDEYVGLEKKPKSQPHFVIKVRDESGLSIEPFLNKVNHIDWKKAVAQLPSHCIDLTVVDPPYGMSFQSNSRKVKYDKIKDDDNLDWLPNWARELHRLCKSDAHLYIFCSWHNIEIFKQELSNFFTVKNILIWQKNSRGMGDLTGDYAPAYEMCIFCSNGERKLNGNRDTNILKARTTGNIHHPTEKPVDLMGYLIEKSSQRGDVVLDTFAGSFSTARAAIETGRNFLCFEIDATYCATAKNLIAGTSERLITNI